MTRPSPSLIAPVGTRVVGESLVWLTAMGLSIGLAMVVGLLGLIIWNGIPVFWPPHLVQLDVKGATGHKLILGVVVKHEHGSNGLERQLYIGNKDLNHVPFIYIPDDTVDTIASPVDALMVERQEYGNALGYAVRLDEHGGESTAADDQRFWPRLHSAIAAATQRHKEIDHLLRHDMDDLDRSLDRLQLRERVRSLAVHADQVGQAPLTAQIADVKARILQIAGRIQALRHVQEQQALVLRLADGRQRPIAIGQIIDAYQPNALSFWQRSARFCTNLGHFLSEDPREANTEGGIFPAIFGTMVMTLLMSVAVVPFGVVAAIYLREYARQGVFVRCVRIAVNNLAGVPSIVFGIFGLGFFIYILGGSIDRLLFSQRLPTPTFGTGGILWASLTLALMTVPVVIVASEEAIAAVPRAAREASLACGASKWQTIQRVVLPACLPGILTGLILAMARGAGEVAPLMLVGVVKLAPSLPIDGHWNDTDLVPFLHLDQKFMHLGFDIFDLGFQSPDSDAAIPMVFATTLFLIILILTLNLSAIIMREKLRRRFATAAF